MQLIIFVGLQGSGKSTLFARQFADTHIRLNMDMLVTRHREELLFDACLVAKQPTVIDNTNATSEERGRYITPAKAHRFTVIGYYFQSRLEDCKKRNESRSRDRVSFLLLDCSEPINVSSNQRWRKALIDCITCGSMRTGNLW